ncbi:hypothetical protein Tsubulata_007942 [Turnera subulata]|uniref:ADP-ribosylation factor GTPase-activating protein AGD4-like n=1 Tax=Turnera subulata TaxID=218843 RepID=A0A9Q0G2N3_9ROSI|nr:hypothetical protein Tsubulata_007942 [Turnera subulata]
MLDLPVQLLVLKQLLTYTQQSKELANIEQDKLAKRIQEFRTDAELCSIRASSNIEPSPKSYDIHGIGKSFETIMLSAADGEVKTIKQGYLLKRSSLRSDWKRRFFVLDSQGTFYYYKNRGSKPTGFQHRPTASAGYDDGVFATFRSRHGRTLSLGERSFGSTVIDLHTSMIKMDAGDANLRLCFRIISPVKTYTLQAENAADRMEWVNKISAVIASLLNSHFLQEPCPRARNVEKNEYIADGPHDIQQSDGHLFVEDANFNSDYVSRSLRGIPGNDRCAECGASGPDWASLNLGILLCIQCSGVHRNLGVHISKVRSLTLDVKVWEPTILDLFHALGNAYCNSIWEGLLLENDQVDKSDGIILSVSKPSPGDTIHSKEKYIHSKYVEKSLLSREASFCSTVSHSSSIWQAVTTNNLQEVYRIIVISDMSIINTTFDEAVNIDLYHRIDNAQESELIAQATERKEYDPFSCPRIKDSKEPASCLQGCSLLHLACHYGNPVMLELLLQFGAHINRQDFHGRTPLHHCISGGNYQLAKFLIRRGASSLIRDGGGLTALDRAMEMGAITDEELFIMLA